MLRINDFLAIVVEKEDIAITYVNNGMPSNDASTLDLSTSLYVGGFDLDTIPVEHYPIDDDIYDRVRIITVFLIHTLIVSHTYTNMCTPWYMYTIKT